MTRASTSAIRGATCSVRSATSEDVDILVGWHADPEVARYWDGETFTPGEMRARLTRPDVDAYVVEVQGEPVGYLQAWFEPDRPESGGLDMFLIPEARGRGIGPDAARALARRLFEGGMRELLVDPYLSNPRAIKAWSKAGFHAVGERPADGEHREPWLLMLIDPASLGPDPAPRRIPNRLPSMYLEVFADNPFDTNCWLLSAEGTDEAVVVDPGFSPDRVHAMLDAAGKSPVAAIATHGHWDHVGEAGAFCGDDLPLYIHEADALALSDPATWGAAMARPMEPVHDLRTIVDGDSLTLGGVRLDVVHTPGHTPGSVCFVADGFLFSGDLVFRGAVGRSDFPNSSIEDMHKSLVRFLEFPDSADVHCGHGPDTTVAHERGTNPFLLEL